LDESNNIFAPLFLWVVVGVGGIRFFRVSSEWCGKNSLARVSHGAEKESRSAKVVADERGYLL